MKKHKEAPPKDYNYLEHLGVAMAVAQRLDCYHTTRRKKLKKKAPHYNRDQWENRYHTA